MQPAVIVADLVLMMQTIVDGKLVGSRGCNNLLDVCDGVRLCQALGDKLIELALRVEEVVIRIDEDHGGVAERHGDVNERTKGPDKSFLRRLAWN